MAAFGGIAAAVPPAFMACVQAFELVQFGRNFKTDFAIPAADLKICEIHLLRWGTAAGLSEAAKGKPPDRLSRYPDDQLKKALQVLERIRDSFETTKKECRFESLDDEEDNGGEDLSGENTEPLEEKRELEHQSQDMKLSHKHLDKSASDRTKWALYKKKHLTELVDGVSKLIDRLERLFPELAEQEQQMAKAEVEGAEKEILEVLPARAAKIDTFMAKALSQEMKVHGMTFKDVEAHGGNVHLGNAYAPGEKSTGNDNHVFEKLRFGGDANFHGGNSYGMGREVRAPEPR